MATQPGSAAIGSEIPHGALVEELLARSFCVFSINPKQRWIASAIAIFQRAPRMIERTPLSWQTRCERTTIVFDLSG
jgi:hypothetical protein